MLSTNFFLFQLSRIAFAFKELLLKKSIDKITINDITEKCGINRQTFYYHFHDIYELITTNLVVCRIWMQCKRIVAFYDSSLFLCIVGKRFCGYTVYMKTKKTTQFKQKGGFLLCIIQQELMKHLQA